MPAAAIIGSVAVGAIGASTQARAAGRAATTQANAATQAAQIQADQADRALGLQRDIYDDQRGIYAPAATLGAGALARQSIMAGGDPNAAREYYANQTRALNGEAGSDPGLDGYTASSWMTTDPGYAFRQQQGQQAIERSAAARGSLYSGATGMELQRYGQDYASNEFMNAFNRLGAISGTGQTATQNIGNSGSNYANSATGTLQYSGNAQANGINAAGAARASGYLAQGNAWGNFFGNTLSGALGTWQGSSGGSGGSQNSGNPFNHPWG